MTYARRILIYVFSGAVLALISADVAFAQTKFLNPLSGAGINSIADFVAKVLKIVVMVALPIISLFIVYSGFLFLMAQGKPEQITKAKMNFYFVIIGAVLILGAWVFASLIGGTVAELTK